MPKTLALDSYATACARLAQLEAEASTIERQIAQASRDGDVAVLVHAQARRTVLPVLIEQARDSLAPLELAHAEAAIAALDAPLADLGERITTLDAQIADLHAERGRLMYQVQEHQQRRQDLDHIRRRAWRRVQASTATA